MNTELTDINIILDCSGSMAAIRTQMEQGMRTYIQEQHDGDGRCTVSLYRFSTGFDVAFEGKPSGEVMPEDLQLTPTGNTALYDGIVKALAHIETRANASTPDHVIVVLITDGEENASKESTKANAQAAIAHVTEMKKFKFAYLAADQKGFAEGRILTSGLAHGTVGQYDIGATGDMFATVTRATHSVRYNSAVSMDVSGKNTK